MKTANSFSVNYFKPFVDQKANQKTDRQVENRARKLGLVSIFNQLWKSLGETTLEPKIRKYIDRFGNISWEIYDPHTGRFGFFTSEAEVYEWLEQRYNK